MKIKISEATLLQLNWLVATCEQLSGNSGKLKICPPLQVSHLLVDSSVWLGGVECRYSTHWEQAGPIIERERFQIYPSASSGWCSSQADGLKQHFGPTPLIAAMRCYVASKLGDKVEIPPELAP